MAAATGDVASGGGEMSDIQVESLVRDLAFILLMGAVVTVLFKWLETAGSAGLYRCGISRKPSFSLSSVGHDGEQHRILGAARHCGAALLSGAGIQLQEIAQHRGLGCGDGSDYRDRDDVYGVCHRPSAEFLPHEQSVSRWNAVDVIDHYHHKGVHRPGTPAEEICLAGIRGAHSRGPVCGAHDGGALVDSHKQQCGGSELLMSVAKLVFFLIIWFLVGVYVLPSALNRIRRYLNSETLLIIALGLCFGMAVFSVYCGFSLALGAFVMGSIIAGMSYAESIEAVVSPVKDLFGAVFFISVGMMVDLNVIVEYFWPILLLSGVVIAGMILFGTFGMLITGQSLRIAMESGFSLTQIGEFAFIIASLGMSLGVLDPTIYPIVVAVSVLPLSLRRILYVWPIRSTALSRDICPNACISS